ncbi:MAG: DsrE family protein [Oleispira antarctica]|uniref:DsrF protein n=1 Tax=Oleispira antarctica RB-8 TaxID=698738 RepID=R4YMA7_OLEAN|nr:DsrE family protein [Oleispira antarctica]MBQ0793606.1 DsrE family protein [Oleispira antarctica]CCK76056.1 DsrF protein [Oleispira antarctica RB-8]|tara:strand:- start:136 stop:477 length:342 start_codon:yes stop_codon:yes gene_type:complete
MTLIILKTAPTPDLEPVELLLALAAFEQNPKLLLLGPGIYHANRLQQEKKPQGKAAAKVLSVLPMYDCEEILISQSDLAQLSLEVEDLQAFCRLVTDDEIKQLIQQSKHCVTF